MGVSFILGVLLFLCGLDSEVHDVLRHRVQVYNYFVHTTDDAWMYPDRGLLGGRITEADSDGRIFLRDASGAVWQIRTVTTTIYQGQPELLPGDRVKVVGLKEGPDAFYAAIVRPWGCCGVNDSNSSGVVQ